jgi:hypothetical protein
LARAGSTAERDSASAAPVKSCDLIGLKPAIQPRFDECSESKKENRGAAGEPAAPHHVKLLQPEP